MLEKVICQYCNSYVDKRNLKRHQQGWKCWIDTARNLIKEGKLVKLKKAGKVWKREGMPYIEVPTYKDGHGAYISVLTTPFMYQEFKRIKGRTLRSRIQKLKEHLGKSTLEPEQEYLDFIRRNYFTRG